MFSKFEPHYLNNHGLSNQCKAFTHFNMYQKFALLISKSAAKIENIDITVMSINRIAVNFISFIMILNQPNMKFGYLWFKLFPSLIFRILVYWQGNVLSEKMVLLPSSVSGSVL